MFGKFIPAGRREDCVLNICHINLAKDFRGGERQTELLIKALGRQGNISQKVILSKDSPLVERLSKAGEKVSLYPISKPYLFHAHHVKDCSLLHVHEAKAGQFAYLATRIYKRPYVITRRVTNPIKTNPLTRRIYSEAERVVALSDAIRDVLTCYEANLNPLVIPSMVSSLPVNPQAIDEIRHRYRDKFLVGHAGALVNHHKGQQYIVEAAASLLQDYPEIHFLLLGRGKDGPWLKHMADGLSNIEFLDFRENLGDYLAAFDLFVFPSLHEGLGSVLLDAMQFKLPIVASSVGGIPDLIEHGKNGLLISSRDSRALADSILYLYRNEEIRRDLAENAYQVSLNYHPHSVSQRYLLLYREILDALYRM